jgi:hypothetical protein
MKSIRFKYHCLRKLCGLDWLSAAFTAVVTEITQGDVFDNGGLLFVAGVLLELPVDDA